MTVVTATRGTTVNKILIIMSILDFISTLRALKRQGRCENFIRQFGARPMNNQKFKGSRFVCLTHKFFQIFALRFAHAFSTYSTMHFRLQMMMKVCNGPNELEAIKAELSSLNQAKHSNTLARVPTRQDSRAYTHTPTLPQLNPRTHYRG